MNLSIGSALVDLQKESKMSLVAIVPLLVMIIGLVLYFVVANPKISAIGFEMYRMGLLVALFVFAKQSVHIGG